MAATTYYYHFDAAGSTERLTDASQATTDTYDYPDAFGGLGGSDKGSVTPNPYRWLGQIGYSSEGTYVDFQVVRRRVYRYDIGRWLSQDPLGFAGTNKGLYQYVTNNPINAIDPSGMEDEACKCTDILKEFVLNPKASPIGAFDFVKTAMNCKPNIFCSSDCGGADGQTFIDPQGFINVCLPETAKTPQLMYGILLHELRHVIHMMKQHGKCKAPTGSPRAPRLNPPRCPICEAREREAYREQARFLYKDKVDRDKFIDHGVCESCKASCPKYQDKDCPKGPAGPPTNPFPPEK